MALILLKNKLRPRIFQNNPIKNFAKTNGYDNLPKEGGPYARKNVVESNCQKISG